MYTKTADTGSGGRTTGSDDDFAWRVLDQMPSAVLVVDVNARVLLANTALVELVGHEPDDDGELSIFDYVHPDDAPWLADAFLDVVGGEPETEADLQRRPSIHVRIVTTSGETIPLEVTGARSVTDDAVGGVIYDVRPARYHDVIGNVLAGMTAGDAVGDLLGLVAKLIALPPLDLEAAVLERAADHWRVVSATSDALADALARGPALPLDLPATEPVRFTDDDIDPTQLAELRSLGFVDVWRVSAGTDDYEIIACSRRRQRRSTSVTERLVGARELATVVAMHATSEGRLRRAAEQDSLTGVFNRATFRRHLTASIDGAPSRHSAVLFLDLDDFKPVNDRYGHAAGDAVLQVVTRRLRAAVRPDDVVARLGGDEFGVLLTADESVDAVPAVARRILEAISAPVALGPPDSPVRSAGTVRVSASIGGTLVRADDSVDSVLGRADRLMYDAKRSGGGQIRIDDTRVGRR